MFHAVYECVKNWGLMWTCCKAGKYSAHQLSNIHIAHFMLRSAARRDELFFKISQCACLDFSQDTLTQLITENTLSVSITQAAAFTCLMQCTKLCMK